MAEKLLASGAVVTDPNTFRITLTLPMELKGFIETRARQKKYASLRADSNRSAFIRDLVEMDREALLASVPRTGKGARVARR